MYHGLTHAEVRGGISRVLEETHQLYDILMLDMPGLVTYGQVVPETLARYRLLVMPPIDIISRADMVTIAAWTRAGGTLAVVDPAAVAKYDELLHAGPSDVLAALQADPGAGEVRTLEWQSIHDFWFSGDKAAEAAAALAAGFAPPRSVLNVSGLPSTAWVTAWVHGAGPQRTVHVVNYDGNASTNELRPIAVPFTIELECDAAGCERLSTVTLHRLGVADALQLVSSPPPPPPLALTFQRRGTTVICDVPAGAIAGVYGVVVFSADEEAVARATAADARMWRERLSIAARSRGIERDAYARQLANAGHALAALQSQTEGDPAVDFTGLLPELDALNRSLFGAVANITGVVETGFEATMEGTVLASGSLKLSAGDTDAAALPKGWSALRSTTSYTKALGYGWLPGQPKICSSAATSSPTVDAVHRTTLNSCPLGYAASGVGDAATRLRIDLDTAAAEMVITLVTGSYGYERGVATTAVNVYNVSARCPGCAVALPGGLVFSGAFECGNFDMILGPILTNLRLSVARWDPPDRPTHIAQKRCVALSNLVPTLVER